MSIVYHSPWEMVMTIQRKSLVRKQKLPISSAHQSRLPLYAPYDKIPESQYPLVVRGKTLKMVSSKGEIWCEGGRLGQVHRDIMDILCTFNEEFGGVSKYDEDGNWLTQSFEFNPYTFLAKYLKLRGLNDKDLGETNRKWLMDKFYEMLKCSIFMDSKGNPEIAKLFGGWGKAAFVVLQSVLDGRVSQDVDDDKIRVSFGDLFIKMYTVDTAIHSERMTTEIVGLPNAQVKALVRFCLSSGSRNFVVNQTLQQTFSDLGLPMEGLQEYRLRKMFTDPQIINILWEKFCIQIWLSEIKNEFLVGFNPRDLDGKVWTDNSMVEQYRESVKIKPRLLTSEKNKAFTKTNVKTNESMGEKLMKELALSVDEMKLVSEHKYKRSEAVYGDEPEDFD